MSNIQTRSAAGYTVVNMQIPAEVADRAIESILRLLEKEGIPVSVLAEKPDFEEDRTYSFEEVFPDFHPGMALVGLRTREGLTQKEMAGELGISQSRLSEFERGKRNITVDMARKIAARYGVSYKSLL